MGGIRHHQRILKSWKAIVYNMEKWNIYYANLGVGIEHEQEKKRPCVIVKVFENINMCLEIPLTSKCNASRFPYTLIIKNNTNNKFSIASIALLFHIRSISINRLESKPIGKISDSNAEKIKEIFRFMLDL